MIKHTNEGREYLFVEALTETAMSILATCDYSMVGMASEATESQAAEIVYGADTYTEYPCYQDYVKSVNKTGIKVLTCTVAIESLASLLTSHGLKMEGTLILQKL